MKVPASLKEVNQRTQIDDVLITQKTLEYANIFSKNMA